MTEILLMRPWTAGSQTSATFTAFSRPRTASHQPNSERISASSAGDLVFWGWTRGYSFQERDLPGGSRRRFPHLAEDLSRLGWRAADIRRETGDRPNVLRILAVQSNCPSALAPTRWNWLQAELAAGQAANQLMIIAAHVPIAVMNVGNEMEWWESTLDPNATMQNAVSLTNLVSVLQNTPNLLMWMAGHRHLNTVKAFLPPSGGSPQNGFWQVETCSLREFPQQFRTFEIYLNSDYSVSIVTVNVDPAVKEDSPAAKSRAYSIAAQQIVQSNKLLNNPNLQTEFGVIPVQTMDPTRPQDGTTDPTIVYGTVSGVPYCASYNAELFKQLSPAMVSVLQAQFQPSQALILLRWQGSLRATPPRSAGTASSAYSRVWESVLLNVQPLWASQDRYW